MADVTMPQLGETVTEGTITRWFKQVGDTVAEDEPLFEVSTDKVDSEVPSPVSGVISEILAGEGDIVEIGQVLARVGAEADPSGGPGPARPAADEPAGGGAQPSADEPSGADEPPRSAGPEPDVRPEPGAPTVEPASGSRPAPPPPPPPVSGTASGAASTTAPPPPPPP
ncbi:MAG: biotin/lipoyl-containing protein, partial [Acidimicrobiales bacterium]